MKLRIEGTEAEIKRFLDFFKQANSRAGQDGIYVCRTVSKFYPNKAFGFERSEPQKDGRVYLEMD